MAATRVPKRTALLACIAKHYELTTAEQNTVLAVRQIGSGDALHAGVNAVTRAGGTCDVPLNSRRKLQEIGGRILHASDSRAP